MSSLNKEALNELLLESNDILATDGKIQSIWKRFTENVSFEDTENFVLRTILSSLEKNVISHLRLSDEECEVCINKFCRMMDELSSVVSYDLLVNFLCALSSVLKEYETMKVQFGDNITINMRESKADVSFLDRCTILKGMMQYNLVDNAELQSLLDDERAGLDKVFNSVMKRHSGTGSSSESDGRDANEIPCLTDVFGTNVDEIERCVRSLLVDEVDRFPNSPSDMTKLLYVVQDSTPNQIGRLYHQGNYVANLGNLKVLAATSQYIGDSFEEDRNTAMYILSQADQKLNKLMSECGNASSLCLSRLVILSMLLRYVKMGDTASPEIQNTVVDIKRQLSGLLNELGDTSSVFIKTTNPQIPKELDDYAQIDSNSLWKFACGELDDLAEDITVAGDELDTAVDELLSDLRDIQQDVMEYTKHMGGDPILGGAFAGSLSSPTTGSEQGRVEDGAANGMVTVLSALAEMLHQDFTGALLAGEREKAANLLARESALLSEFPTYGFREDELRSSKERLERDISTYTVLLERVPGGVTGRLESASEWVHSTIKAKTT
ncbi:MAG: hypothetical protein NC548_28795 [Lachnospiraceae bacterium]|nr:hypothetical protein [Lachnospiraceae bacterium]